MKGNPPVEDDLRPDYGATLLKDGVRGKYVQRYQAGTNLVLLAPDVAAVFPTADAVNDALRLLITVAETAHKTPRRSTRKIKASAAV